MAEQQEQEEFQKTEEPTPKRLEDAIKRGHVAHSKEVTSFILLSLITIFIVFALPGLAKSGVSVLKSYVTEPHKFLSDYNNVDFMQYMKDAVYSVAAVAVVSLVLAFASAIVSGIIQNGVIYAPEAIEPKLSKISPFAGLKKIFSIRNVAEFLKGIVKIAIISAILAQVVYLDIDKILNAKDATLATSFAIMFDIVIKMLIAVCIMQGIIAAIDYVFQRKSYIDSLRMTKQEVKEEMKQSEGDPQIKAKIRSLRMQRARRRIATIVPTATVVITNPTHIAVALEYRDEMPAPKLIAKGQDKIALQIRQIASKHAIPLIENKPLARSLYEEVDWDEYIKEQHYKAVAQIMTRIRRVAGKSK